MSPDQVWLSPTAKRAARDDTRREVQARRRDVTDAMRADWAGEDADTYNIVDAALKADGEGQRTVWMVFWLASRALSELSVETGTSRDELLKRLLH